MRGVDGERFFVGGTQGCPQGTGGIGDTVERQTGISADKACGIAQCGVGGVKIGACCLGGESGLSAKVQRFCRGRWCVNRGREMPATASSICPGTKAVHINGMGTRG